MRYVFFKMSKKLLRCSAITIFILLLVAFAAKYKEENYKSSNIQVENEDDKVSIKKLEIPIVSSSAIKEITEPEVQMTAETHQQNIATVQILEKVQVEPIEPVEPKYVTEPYIIECTAYNPTGNPCRDGTYPVEGDALAGKYSWLGRHCNLYYCTSDGQIGNLIGTYTFHDTGFGHDPDGDGIGSIQTGERIDLYMESYQQAVNWGVQNVYIEFLD